MPNELSKNFDNVTTKGLHALESQQPGSEEYGRTLDHMVKLNKLKDESVRKLPSADTMLLCATNILGILLVTKWEQSHVITSKAFAFIQKPR